MISNDFHPTAHYTKQNLPKRADTNLGNHRLKKSDTHLNGIRCSVSVLLDLATTMPTVPSDDWAFNSSKMFIAKAVFDQYQS
jgi:hypothetical protein